MSVGPDRKGTRADYNVAAARAVADWLEGQGEHKRAEDVRRLCRCNASYRVTLSTLHRDNMELRGRLK